MVLFRPCAHVPFLLTSYSIGIAIRNEGILDLWDLLNSLFIDCSHQLLMSLNTSVSPRLLWLKSFSPEHLGEFVMSGNTVTLWGFSSGVLKSTFLFFRSLNSWSYLKEISKPLQTEQGPLYIFQNIPSGSPRGESSRGSFLFQTAISSVALRKWN